VGPQDLEADDDDFEDALLGLTLLSYAEEGQLLAHFAPLVIDVDREQLYGRLADLFRHEHLHRDPRSERWRSVLRHILEAPDTGPRFRGIVEGIVDGRVPELSPLRFRDSLTREATAGRRFDLGELDALRAMSEAISELLARNDDDLRELPAGALDALSELRSQTDAAVAEKLDRSATGTPEAAIALAGAEGGSASRPNIDQPATLVVDGSNIAHEGRSRKAGPSWNQLRNALLALEVDLPATEIVVVVDASFPHKIPADERAPFAAERGKYNVLTTPAGVIGRGDAAILQIAAKSGATVVSNDSFKEFQAQHPWLFEAGRLVGMMPVGGAWVILQRRPVRAP